MKASPAGGPHPVPVVLVHQDAGVRRHCADVLSADPDIHLLASVSSCEALAAAHLHRQVVMFIEAAQVADGQAAVLPGLRAGTRGGAVALLTAQQAEDDLLSLLIGGARGYLDPVIQTHWLPKAARALAAGEAWVPRRMVARLLDMLVPPQAEARVARA